MSGLRFTIYISADVHTVCIYLGTATPAPRAKKNITTPRYNEKKKVKSKVRQGKAQTEEGERKEKKKKKKKNHPVPS